MSMTDDGFFMMDTQHELMMEMEKLLKNDHIMILGDLGLLSFIEHKIYMDNNNEDFKLFSGSFSDNYIMFTSIALVKKNQELRELLGAEDNKKWKHLLAVCQGDSEGFHMLRLDAVYELPKWGKIGSIRKMLNCIFTTFDVAKEAEEQGIPFSWGNLVVMYCYDEEYQEYWFKKGKKKQRKRTHIPRGLKHEVFKRDNYTCVECGARKEDGATLHVDHKIPVSKGGTDELDNLQTLCSDCNLNKSDVIQ